MAPRAVAAGAASPNPEVMKFGYEHEEEDADDFPQAGGDARLGEVDPDRDLYPQCIVWTPIHGCTWCFPFVGHMGIATSHGEVWEFMGGGATRAPSGGLSFGPVCRYLQLGSRWVSKGTWDQGVQAGIKRVNGNMHGACVSNCHSFVAECLHEMQYAGIPFWSWLSYLLAIWTFVAGRFVSPPRTLVYVIPCVIACAFMYFTFFSGNGSSPRGSAAVSSGR
mmetsp:Transcript_32129/g.84848  ORF Transcript_32129/g.84848 Transcript_32129/m.84848 type:complete len:221 (-) Transcript_32129:41-703(-)